LHQLRDPAKDTRLAHARFTADLDVAPLAQGRSYLVDPVPAAQADRTHVHLDVGQALARRLGDRQAAAGVSSLAGQPQAQRLQRTQQ
jgi:hypothetical protein